MGAVGEDGVRCHQHARSSGGPGSSRTSWPRCRRGSRRGWQRRAARYRAAPAARAAGRAGSRWWSTTGSPPGRPPGPPARSPGRTAPPGWCSPCRSRRRGGKRGSRAPPTSWSAWTPRRTSSPSASSTPISPRPPTRRSSPAWSRAAAAPARRPPRPPTRLPGARNPGASRCEPAAGEVRLAGHLTVPEDAPGIVVFAHGSGSSRHSPRNRYVAGVLNEAGLGTLLFDLLTPEEELDRANVFDIGLLARRLAEVTGWLRAQPEAAPAADRLLRRQHRSRGRAVGRRRTRRGHRGRGVPRRPTRPRPPPAGAR